MKRIAIVGKSIAQCEYYFKEYLIKQLGYVMKDVRSYGKVCKVGEYEVRLVSEGQRPCAFYGLALDECYVIDYVDNDLSNRLKSSLARTNGKIIECYL